jgi:hypothetical protein
MLDTCLCRAEEKPLTFDFNQDAKSILECDRQGKFTFITTTKSPAVMSSDNCMKCAPPLTLAKMLGTSCNWEGKSTLITMQV